MTPATIGPDSRSCRAHRARLIVVTCRTCILAAVSNTALTTSCRLWQASTEGMLGASSSSGAESTDQLQRANSLQCELWPEVDKEAMLIEADDFYAKCFPWYVQRPCISSLASAGNVNGMARTRQRAQQAFWACPADCLNPAVCPPCTGYLRRKGLPAPRPLTPKPPAAETLTAWSKRSSTRLSSCSTWACLVHHVHPLHPLAHRRPCRQKHVVHHSMTPAPARSCPHLPHRLT